MQSLRRHAALPTLRRGGTARWPLLAALWSFGACATGDAEVTDAGTDVRVPPVQRDVRPDDTEPPLDAPADIPGEASGDGWGADEAEDLDPDEIVALDVTPAAVVIEATLGAAASAPLRVTATTRGGDALDVTGVATWNLPERPRVTIDSDGTVTTLGTSAGSGVATVTVRESTATVDVTVTIADTVLDGVTEEEAAVFDVGITPAGRDITPTWTYPEDGTVYPAGLGPLEWRWLADGATAYRIELAVGDHVRFSAYTRTPVYRPTPAQWRLVEEAAGATIRATVLGVEGIGGAPAPSAPLDVRTADASLNGAIYYWQVRTGDIMEIPEGEAARPLFPNNAETGTCRGCHAITRDGGRIGFMYNGGDNPRAGLAWVGAPDPPIVENNTSLQWNTLSFEPAGLRAAAIHDGTMWLADTTPGLVGGVARLGEIVRADGTQRITHPAWSPDGSTIAFIRRSPNDVDWSFTDGELWTVAWNPADETFGAPTPLYRPPGDTSDTASYPTWTPDGRWLAFNVGPSNRGEPGTTMWIADPLSGDATELRRAASRGHGVFPAFSPYREGGYYWLLFYTTRSEAGASSTKQLWVTAIDATHVPGTDPSHPAFWLPGQNPAENNITGYWARPRCSSEANACKTDDDCCVGLQCLHDAEDGGETCQRVACVLPGRPCAAVDTCCPGYECGTSLVGTDVCIEVLGDGR